MRRTLLEPKCDKRTLHAEYARKHILIGYCFFSIISAISQPIGLTMVLCVSQRERYFYGRIMRKKKNLKQLLNLGLLDYTNITTKIGDYDMPYVSCGIVPKIDFLATYSNPGSYYKTQNTAVSFFEYDKYFDGLYGLWNGIYYGVKEIQDFYKERFKNVKYFIAPDYSKCGDSLEVDNIHRQMRMRISAIWLTMNTDGVVIPLVSCANELSKSYMLDGMEDCKTVAFNAKGAMGDPSQMVIFKDAIKHTVDHLNLESIVVLGGKNYEP